MRTRLIQIAALLGFMAAGPAALAQDIQERTIKFGHLNNTDHPKGHHFSDVVKLEDLSNRVFCSKVFLGQPFRDQCDVFVASVLLGCDERTTNQFQILSHNVVRRKHGRNKIVVFPFLNLGFSKFWQVDNGLL